MTNATECPNAGNLQNQQTDDGGGENRDN